VRAAVLHSLGSPPSYRHYGDPRPGPDETLVRVTAAPITPLDVLCASGTSYFGAPAVPYVPGVQGVGRVEQSGAVEVGTRVWFQSAAGMTAGDGGLAELAVVADPDLVPVAGPVGDTALAALGLSAVAAWMSLTWRAGLRAGERVLVLGGGGAVGQAAVGAARVLGAHRVVAVCRSEGAAARAVAAGAHQVVDGSGDPKDLGDRMLAACGGRVDVVVDPVFGAAASAASAILADGGRLVNLGGAASDAATFSSADLRSRSAAILGYTNNALTAEQRRVAITAICQHAAVGALQVAHEVHPLADIEWVWRRQATGETSVRYVVRM
jgi:NADPH:quinone reductase-like Zn-dependent oxidoreductase